jgi:hypothetical protein
MGRTPGIRAGAYRQDRRQRSRSQVFQNNDRKCCRFSGFLRLKKNGGRATAAVFDLKTI